LNSLIGGFLFGRLGIASGALIGPLVTALVGAIVQLAIVGAITSRHRSLTRSV